MRTLLKTFDKVDLNKAGVVATIDTTGYEEALVMIKPTGGPDTTIGAGVLEALYGLDGSLHRSFVGAVFLAGNLPLISTPIDLPGNSLQLTLTTAIDARVEIKVLLRSASPAA